MLLNNTILLIRLFQEQSFISLFAIFWNISDAKLYLKESMFSITIEGLLNF